MSKNELYNAYTYFVSEANRLRGEENSLYATVDYIVCKRMSELLWYLYQDKK